MRKIIFILLFCILASIIICVLIKKNDDNVRVVTLTVKSIGQCKDVFGGCLECGVIYSDGSGGSRCYPVIGASYSVLKFK